MSAQRGTEGGYTAYAALNISNFEVEMGQYFLISLKSAEFGIFSQLKVQSNPVNSRNLEKHDIPNARALGSVCLLTAILFWT